MPCSASPASSRAASPRSTTSRRRSGWSSAASASRCSPGPRSPTRSSRGALREIGLVGASTVRRRIVAIERLGSRATSPFLETMWGLLDQIPDLIPRALPIVDAGAVRRVTQGCFAPAVTRSTGTVGRGALRSRSSRGRGEVHDDARRSDGVHAGRGRASPLPNDPCTAPAADAPEPARPGIAPGRSLRSPGSSGSSCACCSRCWSCSGGRGWRMASTRSSRPATRRSRPASRPSTRRARASRTGRRS